MSRTRSDQSARRVLVVDDEANARLTMKAALEPLGYEIVLAASGEEAVEAVSDPAVELVLLDLKMPGIDGLHVLERIEAVRPGLSVVVVTAHGTVDRAVQSMKRGAIDVVQKPFSLEQIRGVVKAQMDEEARKGRSASEYDSRIATARTVLRERQFASAREHLDRALAEDEGRPEAYNLLGALAYATGDRLEGQRQWRLALAHDPSFAPAQRNLSLSMRGPAQGGPLDLGD
jgi:two-component system, OmpR family, alkaline phosphatase synthesis response regulator PhoP